MPIRSPRASASAAHTSPYIRRAVVYHATMITILWVLVLFLSLGFGITLLQSNVRLDVLERQNAAQTLQISELSGQIASLQSVSMAPATTTVSEMPAIGMPTSTVASSGEAVASAPLASLPNSALNRGSLSPDGTKYAGYDDTTAGKMGIGVQVTGETRIRHIVIFNPKTEFSGNGTPSDAGMVVRWKDNKTFSYDVLVLKNGVKVLETRDVTLFF